MTDVIVIGAGLAGLLSAVHAVKAGAQVRVIAAGWGQQMVTPGWISVCDRADDDVIAEVRGYAALNPDHPYALVGDDALVAGIDSFRAMMQEIGLPHDCRKKDGHNLRLTTLLGAVSKALLAPRGLANGDLTDLSGPLLLVGFRGWRDFQPELAAGNLRHQGIEARSSWVDLPESRPYWDNWASDLARHFDQPDFRAQITKQVQTNGAVKVGFPAVLGLEHHLDVLTDLAEKIGAPVFEIPTLPPSLPGMRLSNGLRRWLLRSGVRVQIGHPVVRGIVDRGRCTGVEVEALGHRNTFYGDQFILATGGLFSGGIESDITGRLWEPIFDLPVQTPPGEGRSGWYDSHLLQNRGHAIHRFAGLRLDHQLRPLDASGAPILENVYAVGNLIAGFNPLTDGCAEGIALATAYKAVHTALKLEQPTHD